MLKQVQEHCGRKPQTASADSGYATGPELAFLEKEGIDGYLPDARRSGAAPARWPADLEAAATSEAAATGRDFQNPNHCGRSQRRRTGQREVARQTRGEEVVDRVDLV